MVAEDQNVGHDSVALSHRLSVPQQRRGALNRARLEDGLGRELVAHPGQPAVQPALRRGSALADDPGNLRHGEPGAETQRDHLALGVREQRERGPKLIAARDPRILVDAHGKGEADPLDRALLGAAPPQLVAEPVHGNRVQPGLLARPSPIESRPRPQRALEGVGEHVFREAPIPAAIDQELEEGLGVLGEEAFEVCFAHGMCSVGNPPSRS